MNVVWSEADFKNMTSGYLDYGTTMTGQSVCEVTFDICVCLSLLSSAIFRFWDCKNKSMWTAAARVGHSVLFRS